MSQLWLTAFELRRDCFGGFENPSSLIGACLSHVFQGAAIKEAEMFDFAYFTDAHGRQIAVSGQLVREIIEMPDKSVKVVFDASHSVTVNGGYAAAVDKLKATIQGEMVRAEPKVRSA